GGQKQRLTIARALARRTEILILDDSLSAVDSVTEKRILDNLRAHWSGDLTVMMISHRIDTMKLCDRVMVLNNGGVEALGTHEECLRASDTYRRLSHLQETGVEA